MSQLNWYQDVTQPIFIVGSPRSGTTLLQCMLSTSPETFSLPETHFFCTILPESEIRPDALLTQKNFQTLSAGLLRKMHFTWPPATEGELAGMAGEQGLAVKQVFAALASLHARHSGKNGHLRLIEKTPYHVFYMDQILGYFPDACFLNIVRDPRDVVSSRLKMPTAAHQSVHQFAEDWLQCIRSAEDFAARHPQKIHTIRYEDLVQNPEKELQDICSFSDLTYTPAMLSAFAGNFDSCTLPGHEPWKDEIRTGAILNRSGVWKERISSSQAEIITAAAGEKMPGYGYQVQDMDGQMNKTNNTDSNTRDSGPTAATAGTIQRFKDIHAGQRCVIIGNGPSLNGMDLSFLKNDVTFASNRIYLGFEKFGFMPDYYLSINPLVIEQSIEEILKIPSPKFLSQQHGAAHVPPTAENVYLMYSLDRPVFSTDPGQGIWEGYTVTYAALQLAYFMGFHEVYLIGCDHSFATRGPANAEVLSTGDDLNHFAPDYFGKGTRWHLPDLENSEMAYSLARMVYESSGRKIFDATLDGKLEVFPKVDYRKVFLTALAEDTPVVPGEAVSAQPLVSVIVSGGISDAGLEKCLQNLQKQTIADRLEVIIPENAPEEDEAILNRGFGTVRRAAMDNSNLFRDWNRGLLAARGRYVAAVRADDMHTAEAFEKLAQVLETTPSADLAYADCFRSSDPDAAMDSSGHLTEIRHTPYNPASSLLVPLEFTQPFWRRDVFTKIGLYDDRLAHSCEHEFLLRFTEAGLDAVHLPETLSLFSISKEPADKCRDPEAETECRRVLKQYRTAIPLSAIYPLQNEEPEQQALAWTALGNQAFFSEIPWLTQPFTDPGFARFCYMKALETAPVLPAMHNLIALLGAYHKWDECKALLQGSNSRFPDDLRCAVEEQRLLDVISIEMEKGAPSGPRKDIQRRLYIAEPGSRVPIPQVCRLNKAQAAFLSEAVMPPVVKMEPKAASVEQDDPAKTEARGAILRGNELLQSGDDQAAREQYQRARELDPSNPEACTSLAALDYIHKKYSSALNLALEALMIKPDYKSGLMIRMHTYRALGDFEKAARSGLDVLQIDPDEPEALLLLGTVALECGNPWSSQSYVERILDHTEHAEAAADLMQRLTTAQARAEDVLNSILASPDPLSEVRNHQQSFDLPLLQLIHRTSSQGELAEMPEIRSGLEALAMHIRSFLLQDEETATRVALSDSFLMVEEESREKPAPPPALAPVQSSSDLPEATPRTKEENGLNHIKNNWNAFGEKDAMWAILTDPRKKGNRWQPGEFFATGTREINALLESLAALGLSVPRNQALDFGCGVGRLSQALALHFESVFGVDIAASMIEKAGYFNRFPDRCSYILNEDNYLQQVMDGQLDLIYTNITLQHIRPEFTRIYLQEFMRILKPGGILAFQLPARRLNAPEHMKQADRFGYNPDQLVMEMHGIPREEVIQWISQHSGTIVQVSHDPGLEKDWESYRYFVKKLDTEILEIVSGIF